MLRAVTVAFEIVGALVLLCVSPILLFWLGRPIEEARRGELVVDPELDSDDPGVDVDAEPAS